MGKLGYYLLKSGQNDGHNTKTSDNNSSNSMRQGNMQSPSSSPPSPPLPPSVSHLRSPDMFAMGLVDTIELGFQGNRPVPHFARPDDEVRIRKCIHIHTQLHTRTHANAYTHTRKCIHAHAPMHLHIHHRGKYGNRSRM